MLANRAGDRCSRRESSARRSRAQWLPAWGLIALLGCQDADGGPARPGTGSSTNDQRPTTPGAIASPSGTSSAALRCSHGAGQDTGEGVLRRLTKLEYGLTLKELLLLPSVPALTAIPEDNDRDGFRTVSALHTLSAQHLEAYLEVAATLAKELMLDAARRDRVLGCVPSATGCLRAFVTRFAELAYRRPVSAIEVDALVESAEGLGLDQTDRFQFVIEAVLSSANFLYRVEVGDQPEGLSKLTPHELAARLSFMLWGRGPSRALMSEAASGRLSTSEGLLEMARTMLKDARTREFYRAFFEQWLRFEQLRSPTVKPADWSEALLSDMREESTRLIDDFAFSAERDFLGALSANYTYLSPALAKFYGLSSSGSGFQKVDIPSGHPRERSGLLTHAALLSAKSDGDPVAIRGNWLKKTFLCQSLELPAGLLDSLGDELVGLTRIEIIKRRNQSATCAGCHAQIDPVGVGFAAFDETGRFDPAVKLADYPIAPALPGAGAAGFASIAELAEQLSAREQVATCLAERVFLFTAGRQPLDGDGCAVESASRKFHEQKRSFLALLEGFVQAAEFRLRRAPQL